MHDNLEDWFKNDYWSHEEAACLMYAIIPTTHHGLSSTVYNVHKVGNIEVFIHNKNAEKVNKILKLFSIFESANWESNDKDGKRIWSEYFKMTERKGIRVDFALKCSKNSFERQNKSKNKLMEQKKTGDKNDSTVTFSKEMKEVLDPIAKLILSFEDNTDYKNRGNKIQQQVITTWLKEKLETEHERRFLKELINNYYSIISARK
jgi:hypothetical protein